MQQSEKKKKIEEMGNDSEKSVEKKEIGQKSVRYNYVMNMILTVSSILFPLISFPYVARVLNPDGIGRVSFAFSIITYFTMVAQLGIPTYGIREIAKLRDDKYKMSVFVKEILVINLVTCLIVYILLAFSIFFIDRLWQERTLILIMSCSVFMNAIGLEWLYKGLEEYAYITKRSILFKFIAFIAMFLLIRHTEDYLIYGFLLVFASVGSNICNLIKAKKYIQLGNAKVVSIKRHMKPIIIFFLLSIATTIYTNLDNVMLGFISGNEEVGYYVAATKIKAALVSVIASLAVVLLPRASYYAGEKMMSEFNKLSNKAMNMTLLLAFPLALYFAEFSKDYIYVLSGKEFAPSIIVLISLMPTVLFIGITNLYGMQILIPIGKEKVVFYSVLGGAVCDFILNILFIPSMGALGAALATCIAELVVLLIQMFYSPVSFAKCFGEVSFVKILIACIISVVGSYFILNLQLLSLVKAIVSALFFFFTYVIVLYIMKESLTRELIMNVVKNRILK
jgi:O-antigen/teichoic acid export membrane protein